MGYLGEGFIPSKSRRVLSSDRASVGMLTCLTKSWSMKLSSALESMRTDRDGVMKLEVCTENHAIRGHET